MQMFHRLKKPIKLKKRATSNRDVCASPSRPCLDSILFLFLFLFAQGFLLAEGIEFSDEAVIKDPSVLENRVVVNPYLNSQGAGKRWKESIGHNPWEEKVKPCDQCYLISFRLPKLNEGEIFVDVNLKVCPFIAANLTKIECVDLYGLLRASNEPDFKESDYFSGENDIQAVKIKANLFNEETMMGINSTVKESTRVVDISDWMNEIYKKGENADKYVFLRFNMNVELPRSNYDLLSLGSNGSIKITYSFKSR